MEKDIFKNAMNLILFDHKKDNSWKENETKNQIGQLLIENKEKMGNNEEIDDANLKKIVEDGVNFFAHMEDVGQLCHLINSDIIKIRKINVNNNDVENKLKNDNKDINIINNVEDKLEKNNKDININNNVENKLEKNNEEIKINKNEQNNKKENKFKKFDDFENDDNNNDNSIKKLDNAENNEESNEEIKISRNDIVNTEKKKFENNSDTIKITKLNNNFDKIKKLGSIDEKNEEIEIKKIDNYENNNDAIKIKKIEIIKNEKNNKDFKIEKILEKNEEFFFTSGAFEWICDFYEIIKEKSGFFKEFEWAGIHIQKIKKIWEKMQKTRKK